MIRFDESHARRCRAQFPGLQRSGPDGRPVVFLDGPAGTQVPERVIEAMADYLRHHNANHGGAFPTSRSTDHLLESAMQAMAEFVGATNWQEIVFGQNMTSLTFQLSRSLATTWSAGDEIVLTRLDHDANIAPWELAARERGVTVRKIDIQPDDYTLCLDSLRDAIGPRTRLVAVGCASNATGGVNPVEAICAWARQAGALTFLDAVHYGPHGLIDVQHWGCDFLACSTYKFFGPHLGVLWGRGPLLQSLPAYKVRPAANDIPWRWMTGTQSHEAIVGALACVDYLADIGRTLLADSSAARREGLAAAMQGIARYESELVWSLIEGLRSIEGVRVVGITDRHRSAERFSTISLTIEGWTPAALAAALAERGIYAWSGNYYALEFTERLGLEPHGMLRLGIVHYNLPEEIDRTLAAIEELVAQRVAI